MRAAECVGSLALKKMSSISFRLLARMLKTMPAVTSAMTLRRNSLPLAKVAPV
jgi:hypothetical protein